MLRLIHYVTVTVMRRMAFRAVLVNFKKKGKVKSIDWSVFSLAQAPQTTCRTVSNEGDEYTADKHNLSAIDYVDFWTLSNSSIKFHFTRESEYD